MIKGEDYTYEGDAIIDEGPFKYMPHGKGRVTNNGGGLFEGLFSYGKKEGFGQKVNPDGSIY